VRVGNQDESYRDSKAMRVVLNVRHLPKGGLHHARQQRFAHPAEGQAGDGDSQLDSIYYLIEILVQF
jgi:hypothetical protein